MEGNLERVTVGLWTGCKGSTSLDKYASVRRCGQSLQPFSLIRWKSSIVVCCDVTAAATTPEKFLKIYYVAMDPRAFVAQNASARRQLKT